MPKIMYSEIVSSPQFFLDKFNKYPEASTFIITGNNIELMYILLNSKVMAYIFKSFYAGGGLGVNGYRYKKKFLINLPIPNFEILNKEEIIIFFESQLYLDDDYLKRLDNHLMNLYELNEKEQEYIQNHINF